MFIAKTFIMNVNNKHSHKFCTTWRPAYKKVYRTVIADYSQSSCNIAVYKDIKLYELICMEVEVVDFL